MNPPTATVADRRQPGGAQPATPLQATLGKRMLGLRIADAAGRRIGLVRSFARMVLWVPSIAMAGAGFLLAAFTARRQALHDLAAGTFVVKRGPMGCTVHDGALGGGIGGPGFPMEVFNVLGAGDGFAAGFLPEKTAVRVWNGRAYRGWRSEMQPGARTPHGDMRQAHCSGRTRRSAGAAARPCGANPWACGRRRA